MAPVTPPRSIGGDEENAEKEKEDKSPKGGNAMGTKHEGCIREALDAQEATGEDDVVLRARSASRSWWLFYMTEDSVSADHWWPQVLWDDLVPANMVATVLRYGGRGWANGASSIPAGSMDLSAAWSGWGDSGCRWWERVRDERLQSLVSLLKPERAAALVAGFSAPGCASPSEDFSSVLELLSAASGDAASRPRVDCKAHSALLLRYAFARLGVRGGRDDGMAEVRRRAVAECGRCRGEDDDDDDGKGDEEAHAQRAGKYATDNTAAGKWTAWQATVGILCALGMRMQEGDLTSAHELAERAYAACKTHRLRTGDCDPLGAGTAPPSSGGCSQAAAVAADEGESDKDAPTKKNKKKTAAAKKKKTTKRGPVEAIMRSRVIAPLNCVCRPCTPQTLEWFFKRWLPDVDAPCAPAPTAPQTADACQQQQQRRKRATAGRGSIWKPRLMKAFAEHAARAGNLQVLESLMDAERERRAAVARLVRPSDESGEKDAERRMAAEHTLYAACMGSGFEDAVRWGISAAVRQEAASGSCLSLADLYEEVLGGELGLSTSRGCGPSDASPAAPIGLPSADGRDGEEPWGEDHWGGDPNDQEASSLPHRYETFARGLVRYAEENRGDPGIVPSDLEDAPSFSWSAVEEEAVHGGFAALDELQRIRPELEIPPKYKAKLLYLSLMNDNYFAAARMLHGPWRLGYERVEDLGEPRMDSFQWKTTWYGNDSRRSPYLKTSWNDEKDAKKKKKKSKESNQQ